MASKKQNEKKVEVVESTTSILRFPCGSVVRIFSAPVGADDDDDACNCNEDDCEECNSRKASRANSKMKLEVIVEVDGNKYRFPAEAVDVVCKALQAAAASKAK